MSASRFIEVEVEPCAGCEDGLSLRFKRAGDDLDIDAIRYESERGLDGVWTVRAADSLDGSQTSRVCASLVDDSSEGVVWLIVGGRYGLVLTHEHGEVERVPYLALTRIKTA